MNHVYLGRTGLSISELCLGTMTFGNEADEETSRAIMDRALDAGVNFFDTADVYNRGATEEIIGRWLAPHRDAIVLASKVHYPTGPDVNARGSSRRHIIQGVEASLARLQTDRLDLLYLHHWDDHVPIEDSMAAISHLIGQGKVLYAGVSNFSAWQTMKTTAACANLNLAPVVATQPMYNLVKRQAEVEILPMAHAENIAVCPYSPMGAGLLTGKYQQGEEGRIDINPMYKERYKDSVYREVSDRFVAFAQERDYNPAALSVAWARSHPAVTSPIIGARNIKQFETALSSQDIVLDNDTRREISALSIEPPIATDREKFAYDPFLKK